MKKKPTREERLAELAKTSATTRDVAKTLKRERYPFTSASQVGRELHVLRGRQKMRRIDAGREAKLADGVRLDSPALEWEGRNAPMPHLDDCLPVVEMAAKVLDASAAPDVSIDIIKGTSDDKQVETVFLCVQWRADQEAAENAANERNET